ncbi:MAG: 50S ribosomal protein L11 methyltransferase [Candidatus Methylomirabilia bacterium]
MTSVLPDPFAHRARRRWRRVVVEVPARLVEAAADIVAEVSGAGVEITMALPPAPPGPVERVIGYLAGDDTADAREALLRSELASLEARSGLPGAIVVRSEPLLEEDWGAGWKEHFHPFHVAPLLVIKPSWEPYEPREGEAVIEMDPGMAFGTGLHASTRLALGFIEEICAGAPPDCALDVGTGTGILAMAAALRGASLVVAIDNDPDAVVAARENVARNDLAGRVSVSGRNLGEVDGTFDLIAANITADVLLSLAPRLIERLAPGGALVLAGLLAGDQTRQVRATCEGLGLLCAGERGEGEWAALLLVAPAGGEVFDLVDEQGRIVGRAPRALCHRTPSLLHRAAHVIVTDGAGRIYLQKRSSAKDIQPGKWDTSVGGHVDAGEDHEAGARREMREELGLAGELRFLYRYLWRTSCETELVETFLHVARSEPEIRPEEIEEGRWFTLEEAAALVTGGGATPNLAEELRRAGETGIL